MKLNKLFESKSVVVIDVDEENSKTYNLSYNLLRNFHGDTYIISAVFSELFHKQTFESLSEIEDPIDVAIIDKPLSELKNVISECVKRKIKFCILISEIDENEKTKEEIKKIKKHFKDKIEIIGPNSIGVYSKDTDFLFFTRKKLPRPIQGNISIIDQSRTIGPTIFDFMTYEGIGISKYISIGSEDPTEILNVLGKDMETRCIIMYIENIENGIEFIKVAKKISDKKPIVVLTSEIGTMKSQIYSEAFKKANIIETDNIEELFDYAKTFEKLPLLKHKGIAIVSNTTSLGKICYHNLINSELMSADYSKNLLKKIEIQDNIIKMPDEETFEKKINYILKDESVAGLIFILSVYEGKIRPDIIDIMADAKIYGKPIVFVISKNNFTLLHIKKMQNIGIPVYASPQRAVKAMEILWKYSILVHH